MADEFPPRVPCVGECAYNEECQPVMYDPTPCGGCCACARACHMEADVERAFIPETPEQAKYRKLWGTRQWERLN